MPWIINTPHNAWSQSRTAYSGDEISQSQPLGIAGRPPLSWFEFIERAESQLHPSLACDLRPTKVILKRNTSSLRDILLFTLHREIADFWISNRVRSIIESFEPDRHFFFPAEVYHRDMTAWPERYWAFKAAKSAVAQAIIVEQSERVKWVPIENAVGANSRRMKFISKYETRPLAGIEDDLLPDVASGISIDAGAFEGRHIVKEAVYCECRVLFFSDELLMTLKREKIRGFKCGRMKTVKRNVPPYILGELTGEVR